MMAQYMNFRLPTQALFRCRRGRCFDSNLLRSLSKCVWAIIGDNLQLWGLLVVKLFELRKFKYNCLVLGEFDRYHSPGGIRSCARAKRT